MELAETYLEYAKNYSSQGNWKEAISFYQKLTELQPNNWEAYQDLGNAFFEMEIFGSRSISYPIFT
ncbi:MAG: tetratricopeptide repeat protein [Okeania sp. SIO2D1]|nr:tetratricopeptide repeat protein [Okeania sp. SIO2D1]